MSIVKDITEKIERRESPSGFHFYNLYLDCPRKWYIKYVNGLRPLFTSPPLLFGNAFHEAKALYWEKDFNADGMMAEFDRVLLELKDQYEDQKKYIDDVARGHRMIDNWLYTWHDENQDRYKVLEVEKD